MNLITNYDWFECLRRNIFYRKFSIIAIIIFFFDIILQINLVHSSYNVNPSTSLLQRHTNGMPIKAAVNSQHFVEFQDVSLPSNTPYAPNLIEVQSSVPSFSIKFNSVSSKVEVVHQHEPSKASKEPKETFSEDEPHILRHQVVKPIIQEVHEIITPFRQIFQEIKPVVENIDTAIYRSVTGNGNTVQSATASVSTHGSNVNTNELLQQNRTSITSSVIGSGNKSSKLKSQSASLIGDKRPDLIINENELFDNTLYNGNNEIDLRYPSFNSDGYKQKSLEKAFRLYEDR
ncbi:hypothetical protein SSS_03230 [Sarcoptes scabiei]|nr:hypothetical protein SSS_03230 [Sarcoptes scabiei]